MFTKYELSTFEISCFVYIGTYTLCRIRHYTLVIITYYTAGYVTFHVQYRTPVSQHYRPVAACRIRLPNFAAAIKFRDLVSGIGYSTVPYFGLLDRCWYSSLTPSKYSLPKIMYLLNSLETVPSVACTSVTCTNVACTNVSCTSVARWWRLSSIVYIGIYFSSVDFQQ